MTTPAEDTFDLHVVDCPLCGPGPGFEVMYPERLAGPALDFRARKTPAGIRFRYVRCEGCGLVYANPVPPLDVLARLYRGATFLRESQVDNMIADYVRQFDRLRLPGRSRPRVLEIGCADGAFLAALADSGRADVWGCEPGRDAVARAPESVRDRIVNRPFEPGLFDADSFDAVCAFQVFDHVVHPAGMTRDIARVLKPGGLLLAINHNVRSLMTRLLGRRSPMFDVEHLQLFAPRTMRRMATAAGLKPLRAAPLASRYTLRYGLKMFPLPCRTRRRLLSACEWLGLAGRSVWLPAGNMVTVARKPQG